MRTSNRHFRAGIFVATATFFVAGCNMFSGGEPASPQIAMFIGNDARLMTHGVPPLVYKVDKPGNIAIVDHAAGSLVTSVSVSVADQQLIISADEATIVLKSPKNPNNPDVLASEIDTQRDYAIYFSPSKTKAK